MIGLLLGLCLVDLPHDLLLLQMLDLLLFGEDVLPQLRHDLPILQLRVRHLRLVLLTQLLSQLLDGFLVIGAKLVHSLTLLDELRAQLILQLRVDLILLSQFLQYLGQVAPAEAKQLSELLLTLGVAAVCGT